VIPVVNGYGPVSEGRGLHQLPAGFGKLLGEQTQAHEAVDYGLADEVIGDPAEAPESGTPA
jgi:hypothetical protein